MKISGAFGVDFSKIENIEDGINRVAKGLLSHGVTSFCPTVVTSPLEIYHTVLRRIKKRPGNKNGATILGIHVEGPFINVEKKGAHPPECIKRLENVSCTTRQSFLQIPPPTKHGGRRLLQYFRKKIWLNINRNYIYYIVVCSGGPCLEFNNVWYFLTFGFALLPGRYLLGDCLVFTCCGLWCIDWYLVGSVVVWGGGGASGQIIITLLFVSINLYYISKFACICIFRHLGVTILIFIICFIGSGCMFCLYQV